MWSLLNNQTLHSIANQSRGGNNNQDRIYRLKKENATSNVSIVHNIYNILSLHVTMFSETEVEHGGRNDGLYLKKLRSWCWRKK